MKLRISFPLIAIILIFGLFAGAAVFPQSSQEPAARGQDSPPPTPTSELEVVFLANEGFLLRSGDRGVLIDAFLQEPYSIYSALPEKVHRAMIGGEPPFDHVQLALASHVHGDHFQAATSRAFLSSHPLAMLASSPDVLEALGTIPPQSKGGENLSQTKTVWPSAGERRTLVRAGIQIDFLRLPHGGSRFAAIQNLGHIIRLGGKKILHIGDADAEPELFTAYRLADEKIDVALIPYFFLYSQEGRNIVMEQIGAHRIIASHIPPAEVEEVRAKLAKEVPQVLIADSPMQSWKF